MNRVKYVARGLVFVIGSLIVTIVVLTLLIIGQILLVRRRWGWRYGLPLMHFWGHALIWLAGCKLEVVHPERLLEKKPRVVISNHGSGLDIYALFATLPWDIRFVMKKQLFWQLFVIGWYLAWRGHYYIDRKDPRQASVVYQHITEEMASEDSTPLAFPEGTRSPDGLLHKLHPGTFKVATKTGAAIQPISILGASTVLPKGHWIPVQSGPIYVVINQLIPSVGKSTRQLADETTASLVAGGVPLAPTSE